MVGCAQLRALGLGEGAIETRVRKGALLRVSVASAVGHDNELASAGWAVRRLGWLGLTQRPAWVSAKVRESLARVLEMSIEKS